MHTNTLIDNLFPHGIDNKKISHLGIAAQYCRKIKLVDIINLAIPGKRKIDIGTMVQALVLDTLAGRSPLYMMKNFIKEQNCKVLLGRDVDPELFNDAAVGRAMDAIFEKGTQQLFSQISFEAISTLCSNEEIKYLNYDTTSKNVYGEYDVPEDSAGPTITYGKSKDHRPDLKQFVVELMCVHQNIPMLGSVVDGNSSDQKLNHKMLTRMSNHLAKHGIEDGAFVYTADAAMVTEYNLSILYNKLFITRSPFTYKETNSAVSRAVLDKEGWEEIPPIEPPINSRPRAKYKLYETTITLYGKEYRAIVVHSSTLDKRRLKRLNRQLDSSVKKVSEKLKVASKIEYFCRKDAEVAAEKLSEEASKYHYLDVSVEEKITYGKGKPPKDPSKRKIASIKYLLKGIVNENSEKIKLANEESGCFVLLTNTPVTGPMAHTPSQVLVAYKEQHGIERNFSFIKNPAILNSVFLHKPERIEVLGFIMLIALLIWNLMQQVMRRNIKSTNSVVEGLAGRKTKTPTTYAMTTKFRALSVMSFWNTRQFNQPLTAVQEKYLMMLEIDPVYLLFYDGVRGKIDEAAILAKLSMK